MTALYGHCILTESMPTALVAPNIMMAMKNIHVLSSHERYPLTMSAVMTIFLVQVMNIYMEDLMKITMIAVMVIGMIALNGCGQDRAGCKRSVQQAYPGKTVYNLGLSKWHFIIVDSGKVHIVETMNIFDTKISDSTTYIVPSKCK